MNTSDSLRTRKDDSFSLARCTWLLKQRSLSFVPEESIHTHIPSRGTHPDFLVESADARRFLVEVESFIQPVKGFSLPRGFAQVSFEAPIKRMQVAVQNGARQLKPYSDLQVPMIVMLDNHRLCGIPSNVEFLRDAVFGQTEFRATWNPSRGQLEDLRIHHGSGQVLSSTRKNYISAVIWNLPKVGFAYSEDDSEVPMRVAGVFNHFASVPFPLDIFDDSDDRMFGYDENGQWKLMSGAR